jgi:hypothetical protein
MESRRAQRAEQEQALRAQLASLASADEEVLKLDQLLKRLATKREALEKELVDLRELVQRTGTDSLDARAWWREAADAVGFTGEPTVDLPARPSAEKRAPRYEKSLILGFNATEHDVALRDSFERAATN